MSNNTGDGKTYQVAMSCDNCGWQGNVSFPVGKEVPSKASCPNCHCIALIKNIAHGDRNWFAETCDVFFNGRAAKP